MKKKLTFLAIIIIILTNSCNNKFKNRIIITERIEYDVPIISNDPDLDWWVQNIEGSKRETFLRKLSASLLSGKLKAYDYNTDIVLSSEQLNKFVRQSNYNTSDTNNILNTYKLRFTEKWYINTKSLEFDKKVLAICPLIFKDSVTSLPLFRIKFDTSNINENKEAVSERIRYDVNIINPANSREWWIENIETSKRDKFINLLLDAGTSGKFKTYGYYNDPVSSEELKKTFSRTDTLKKQKPYPPYDSYDTVVHNTINKKEITKIRFLEEWFYDNNSSSFTKKVKGINPIIRKYDEATGEFRGKMPLFWIYSDKKYPLNQSK